MENSNVVKRKTVVGLLWSFLELFLSQGIQFVVIIILARLLAPEHFGLVAMVTVFLALCNSLIDSGFSQALIRETNVSQEDYSTVFFFNLFMAFFLVGILCLFAPFIATFFHYDQLTSILRVLSMGLIINSLGIIQRVILIKNVNFKTQMKISTIAVFCGGLIGIILAIMGFGVWSLVIQSLSSQIMQTVLLWTINKWKPSFVFNIISFKKLFNFGSKLLISGLIDTFYNNISSIIIGRVYPANQLGFYSNAVKIRDIIVTSTTSAIQRVTYPVLSEIQEDEIYLSNSFRKIIKTSGYVMFPIMFGIIAISDSLIPLLLGGKWFESVLYFKLLCIAGLLYPLHAINLNILQVKGRSDLFLKLEIIKKVLLTLLIGGSLYFSLGIIGLIGATIISSFISLFINAYYSAREISYTAFQQIKDLLPSFLIAFIMSTIVYTIGLLSSESMIFILVLQIVCGILLYIVLSLVFKINEFVSIYQIIVQLLKGMYRIFKNLRRYNLDEGEK